jgi:hypothetical protein
MRTKHFFIAGAIVLVTVAIIFFSCEYEKQSTSPASSSTTDTQSQVEGEEYLVEALDELESLADLSVTATGTTHSSILASLRKQTSLSSVSADTTFVYGEVTTNGYGATVKEKITHPKGLFLITVTKSYGKQNGHTVTETKKYSSVDDYQNGLPQATSTTEVYGLSKDTIVTHVIKNNTSETYTFKLPVITRTINALDGSIKVSSRYGLNNMVVTEVSDGVTNVVSQIKKSYGANDGSLISRIEYPANGEWKQTRTLGRADGSILKEVTSNY